MYTDNVCPSVIRTTSALSFISYLNQSNREIKVFVTCDSFCFSGPLHLKMINYYCKFSVNDWLLILTPLFFLITCDYYFFTILYILHTYWYLPGVQFQVYIYPKGLHSTQLLVLFESRFTIRSKYISYMLFWFHISVWGFPDFQACCRAVCWEAGELYGVNV